MIERVTIEVLLAVAISGFLLGLVLLFEVANGGTGK